VKYLNAATSVRQGLGLRLCDSLYTSRAPPPPPPKYPPPPKNVALCYWVSGFLCSFGRFLPGSRLTFLGNVSRQSTSRANVPVAILGTQHGMAAANGSEIAGTQPELPLVNFKWFC